MVGSCDGGTQLGAFQFAREVGVPYHTCLAYEYGLALFSELTNRVRRAQDFACTPMNTCRNCMGPHAPEPCEPVFNFTRYFVDQCAISRCSASFSDVAACSDGLVKGVDKIMAEVVGSAARLIFHSITLALPCYIQATRGPVAAGIDVRRFALFLARPKLACACVRRTYWWTIEAASSHRRSRRK